MPYLTFSWWLWPFYSKFCGKSYSMYTQCSSCSWCWCNTTQVDWWMGEVDATWHWLDSIKDTLCSLDFYVSKLAVLCSHEQRWNLWRCLSNNAQWMVLFGNVFVILFSIVDVTSVYYQLLSLSVLLSLSSSHHVQLNVALWHSSSSLVLYLLTVILLLTAHWFCQSSTPITSCLSKWTCS